MSKFYTAAVRLNNRPNSAQLFLLPPEKFNTDILNKYLLEFTQIIITFLIQRCDEILLDFPLGSLKGKTRTTIDGVTIHSFQGIPYAEPVVNESRFQVSLTKSVISLKL